MKYINYLKSDLWTIKFVSILIPLIMVLFLISWIKFMSIKGYSGFLSEIIKKKCEKTYCSSFNEERNLESKEKNMFISKEKGLICIKNDQMLIINPKVVEAGSTSPFNEVKTPENEKEKNSMQNKVMIVKTNKEPDTLKEENLEESSQATKKKDLDVKADNNTFTEDISSENLIDSTGLVKFSG